MPVDQCSSAAPAKRLVGASHVQPCRQKSEIGWDRASQDAQKSGLHSPHNIIAELPKLNFRYVGRDLEIDTERETFFLFAILGWSQTTVIEGTHQLGKARNSNGFERRRVPVQQRSSRRDWHRRCGLRQCACRFSGGQPAQHRTCRAGRSWQINPREHPAFESGMPSWRLGSRSHARRRPKAHPGRSRCATKASPDNDLRHCRLRRQQTERRACEGKTHRTGESNRPGRREGRLAGSLYTEGQQQWTI